MKCFLCCWSFFMFLCFWPYMCFLDTLLKAALTNHERALQVEEKLHYRIRSNHWVAGLFSFLPAVFGASNHLPQMRDGPKFEMMEKTHKLPFLCTPTNHHNDKKEQHPLVSETETRHLSETRVFLNDEVTSWRCQDKTRPIERTSPASSSAMDTSSNRAANLSGEPSRMNKPVLDPPGPKHLPDVCVRSNTHVRMSYKVLQRVQRNTSCDAVLDAVFFFD